MSRLPFTVHNTFTMIRLPCKTENGKRSENGKQKMETYCVQD